MEYTDIHTHIIPGVDDGAVSMEQSVLMLERAYNEGVRNIIATPHFGVRNTGYRPEIYEENLNALMSYASEHCPNMKLFRGNELYYGPGIFSGLEDGMANTLAGSRYALVEFPFVTDFEEMFHGVRKFLTSGYIPIIAHVERYRDYIGKLVNLEDLVSQGALVQMNCSTIVNEWKRGFMGKKSWPIKALKAGLVHFIASDCHDMGERAPQMLKAAECLEEIVGREKAEEILVGNPGMVIER